ncbi:MAG TPA: hypothetical protein VMH32_04475 [Burkholderiales bacterium]|nr:hypothetical protein [Burkholderiales bacterium]
MRVEDKVKNGKLSVDPLTANLYEGSMQRAVAADANANQAVSDVSSPATGGFAARHRVGTRARTPRPAVTADA